MTSNRIRLWLDDLRAAPEGWHHARTAAEAIALLAAGGVVEVSLDHDLGDEPGVGSGYDVACWIEQHAMQGTLQRLDWRIHSANPVGRKKMKAALESAERFWRGIERAIRWKGALNLDPARPTTEIEVEIDLDDVHWAMEALAARSFDEAVDIGLRAVVLGRAKLREDRGPSDAALTLTDMFSVGLEAIHAAEAERRKPKRSRKKPAK